MSKRPITYPNTPERPAKRRNVSSATFSGSASMDVDSEGSIHDPMDVDEVTSTLKRKLGKPPDVKGSNKVFALTGWAEQMDTLGIREPDRKGFVHQYVPKQEVVVGIPEPSTSGYKMSTNYNRMTGTTYKYLHVDSSNRLTHETNSKLTVNFGGLPIENIRRVGVLKATITNTGHNCFEGHDEVKIGVRIGANHVFATLTLDHDYYTIVDMVSALNTKLQAYTNAPSAFQNAVRDLVFEVTNADLVVLSTKVSPATPTGTAVSYALIADHKTDSANTLLYELGFDKSFQTLDPGRYTDYLNANFLPDHTGLILPSQNFNGRLMYLYGDGTPQIHYGLPNIRGLGFRVSLSMFWGE